MESSKYTPRQIIQKLTATLRAKKSTDERDRHFSVLVVATHRDCVKDDLTARVDALNQELRELLLPACEDELILYRSCEEIAFVLNLKDPDDYDEEILEMI